MAREVFVKLIDGTSYEVHRSAVAAAVVETEGESAHDIVRGIWGRIANHEDLEPLLLKSPAGDWAVSKLTPSAVIGVFLVDPDNAAE